MQDESRRLLPTLDLTRRDFTVTTLAAGFALAVQPVSAQTITTDTKGLHCYPNPQTLSTTSEISGTLAETPPTLL